MLTTWRTKTASEIAESNLPEASYQPSLVPLYYGQAEHTVHHSEPECLDDANRDDQGLDDSIKDLRR